MTAGNPPENSGVLSNRVVKNLTEGAENVLMTNISDTSTEFSG